MRDALSIPAKILIVDDEPFSIDYLEQLLTDLGYRTVTATNGEEALAQVAREVPDLILLDVMMPVMDGFTACRTFKENEATQLIPVIIMTALGAREDRIKGIAAGADDFLTRPVNRRELLARIETALKHKHAIDRIRREVALPSQSVMNESDPPQPQTAVTTHGQADVDENFFRQHGEFWTIGYQGTHFHLKDTKGVRYLSYLLAHPHKDVHVLDFIALDGVSSAGASSEVEDSLVDNSRGFSDAPPVLDLQARAAYKRRLAELQAALAQAEAFHDLAQVDRLQYELGFLEQELRSAIGLSGRNRKMTSYSDQVRVNVTKVMKAVIRKIQVLHPVLGQHLNATVKTGLFCSYSPDPRAVVLWKL
ncbi:MAG: response regulator [Candidatus Binatia bacterium]